MPDDNSLDDVLDFVGKLLGQIQDNKEKFLSYEASEKVNKQLDQLEKDVDQFVKDTEQMLHSAGLSDKDLRHALWKVPDELPEEEKQALIRAKKMREKLKDVQQEFLLEKNKAGGEVVEEARPSKEEENKEKPKKKKNKSHRSKYKRLGGDHWKPL